jgi:hypothetical protein
MTDMHIGVRMWSTSAVGFVEKSGAENWVHGLTSKSFLVSGGKGMVRENSLRYIDRRWRGPNYPDGSDEPHLATHR